jgi:pimeloyl-ACP methyl ester carboxylesterase
MSNHPWQTKSISLKGRRLSFCEFGDPQGRPVFYFHGTPGSRFEAKFSHQPGKDHAIRIIAPDRPGIGRSDPAPDRELMDWPRDIAELAQRCQISRFGVIGVSGGGPYALACQHALPKQVDFTVLMGSWGPVAEEPALWQEMAPLDRFFGKLSRVAPWAFTLPFSFFGLAAKHLPPKAFIKSLHSSMSQADKALMSNPEMARFFAQDVAECFRQGARGPARDAMLPYGAWGFPIDAVTGQILLHHGMQDQFAPIRFARYLEARLSNAQLRSYPGEGHLFVMQLFDPVFSQVSS